MPAVTTPLVAVDIIIELVDRDARPIVLIERKNPPYGWAIPGGFVDVGETLERAAVREAKEETSLEVTLTGLLGNYSDPGRDARHHTVSAVYIAHAIGEPKAADDAAHLALFTLDTLPDSLAFDHHKILADYARLLQSGQLPSLSAGLE
ncbi:MAG: NUDIX hydrolase [Gammaproteobacteria bacterium]|jgi:8-oxo-dGTP diphosphatase|nr:NUDIX hydrolase [Gammaproteobacteria bacterium]